MKRYGFVFMPSIYLVIDSAVFSEFLIAICVGDIISTPALLKSVKMLSMSSLLISINWLGSSV